eukprot:scaffold376937_cov15-Prasinocladus_malaysianus.AAC.1
MEVDGACWANPHCNDAYNYAEIADSMMCAAGIHPGHYSCRGGSRGPSPLGLIVKVDDGTTPSS